MLQALIHNKISKWLTKEPWQIEDLLTSIVFGSCEYTETEGWRNALRPFLAAAIAQRPSKSMLLDELLPHDSELESIDYEFWPACSAFNVTAGDRFSGIGSPSPDEVIIKGAIPEVLITLRTQEKGSLLLLIEVKLNIGKSCYPSDDCKVIGDQLAKYWKHLENVALERQAQALAIVYITPGRAFPSDEIRESRRELSEKLQEDDVPIYWISWRQFVPLVENHVHKKCINLPKILKHTISLLKDQWGFVHEEIQPWPSASCFGQLKNVDLLLSKGRCTMRIFQALHVEMYDWQPVPIITKTTRFTDMAIWPSIINVSAGWSFSE